MSDQLFATCARLRCVALRFATLTRCTAAVLFLCTLCACAGPKYWSFGFSSAIYGHMSTASDTSGVSIVLFLLPLALDLVVLPVAALHDLFVYLFS